MKPRLVAVSPHLDDAAFSAGGTLAHYARDGGGVTVVTCFTGNVAQPRGFALACQLDKGLGPEVDYMALRRGEDERACQVIGATPVHLPFLEAPHRGYESAPALFGRRLATDDMADRLAPELARLVEGATLILGPLGIGDHVDHHIVREALERVADAERLCLWEDWPYLDRAERVPPDPDWIVDLDHELTAKRIAMCAAYESQLGFQFGGREAMEERLARIEQERFHAIPAPYPRKT
ncbi:PIG-L deacetylase family protein [Sphingomonas lenta]|uniref:PIG-L family deacetylase n=1 Tax=Sphingomonas lenta TaxID=1141887 RepID=A0A2A2SH97_9SPHN|nr:PIG-L family deacetylase [Sphingomonas lenta]PAX08637.1 PIG-L family deacetylase [Sphingomonas lenta]